MRLWLGYSALAVAATACFAPAAPTGARCAQTESNSRCPAGQQCIAHDGIETCELPGTLLGGPDANTDTDEDAPPIKGDRDSDGIVDSVDNCPDIKNATQDDEDGDELGDACDPCPVSADNADGDGDGLGDACDPNPVTPGDKLAEFVGFSSPLPSDWDASGLFMMNSGDGSLVAGDGANAMLVTSAPQSGKRVELRASMVIDLITASGLNLGSVNLIDRMQPSTDKSIACQLSGLANGTDENLRIFDASTAAVVTSTPHAFATGVQTELRLRRNGTSYACRATGPAEELAGSAAFSPASPKLGVRVHGAAARFHWVMIVTSP